MTCIVHIQPTRQFSYRLTIGRSTFSTSRSSNRSVSIEQLVCTDVVLDAVARLSIVTPANWGGTVPSTDYGGTDVQTAPGNLDGNPLVETRYCISSVHNFFALLDRS